MATAPVNPFGDVSMKTATPDQTGAVNPFGTAQRGASTPDAAAPSQQDPLMSAVKGEDVNIPLTSHGVATEQGLLDVVSGTSRAVQGAYQGAKGIVQSVTRPQSAVEAALGPAGSLITGALKGAPDAANSAAQVPGAIRDINASPDPTGTYLRATGKAAGEGAGQALTAAATSGVGQGAARAVRAAKNLVGIPQALSEDTAGTLARVADKEGLPPMSSTNAREAADELQQSYIKRAKDQYSIVDKAVDGDLKPVQERITQLKKAIRAQANVNPDLAEKFSDDLATQKVTLRDLVAKAKANGVPNAEELMAAGDRDYARGIAMKKVSAGFKTASGEVRAGGHPNPALFATQVDRMNNIGLLQRALGDEGAQAMVDTAKEGLRKAKALSVTKKVAIGGAAAGASGAIYAGAKSALKGQ